MSLFYSLLSKSPEPQSSVSNACLLLSLGFGELLGLSGSVWRVLKNVFMTLGTLYLGNYTSIV